MSGAATTYLLQEHETITRALNLARLLYTQYNLKKEVDMEPVSVLLDFFSGYADKIHHAKEEDVLFPYLDKMSVLSGGPHCSYYSSLRFISPPIEKVIHNLNEEMHKPDEVKNHTITEGNPLNPILEEHALGRKLIERLRFELEGLQKKQKTDFRDFFYYLNRYIGLLEEHIKKEDTCLFYMVDYYFDENIQQEIVARFKEVDQKIEKELKYWIKMISDLEKPG